MRLKVSISEMWRKIVRPDTRTASLTVEDYLALDSMKSRPGDASEFALLEECFGIGREIAAKPAGARKIA